MFADRKELFVEKTRSLNTSEPTLIQRCYFRDDGKLQYDYMGSSEFENGDQGESLKRIFAQGITAAPATASFNGREVLFYLIAGKGFDFKAYESVIRGLIDEKWRTKEATRLARVLQQCSPAFKKGESLEEETVIWFDFVNDVLFTHDSKQFEALLAELRRIQGQWARPKRRRLSGSRKT